MRKIKNNKFKIVLSVLLITLLTVISSAYYTNTNRFFEQSRTPDGNLGFALERNYTNDFIVDGCGIGTMLDTVTGICWDKNMNHNGITLKWAISNTYAEPTWDNINKVYSYPSGKSNYPAFSYCEDLVLGDYSDWRLPTREELMTLINETGPSGSTCNSLISLNFSNCQNSWYWTEDEYKTSTSNAWIVHFSYGYDGSHARSGMNYVVCVRRD